MRIITTFMAVLMTILLAGCATYPYSRASDGPGPWWAYYDVNRSSATRPIMHMDGSYYYEDYNNDDGPRQYYVTEKDEQKYQQTSSMVEQRLQAISRQ